MENEARAAAGLVEECSTREEALKTAIHAAELYLKASVSASSKLEKAELRRKCQQLLSKAESIKALTAWTPRICQAVDLKSPSSRRVLTKREEIILLESSKLHGLLFPQWTSDPEDSEFDENLDEPPLYFDPANLRLSTTQRESFAGWKRLPQISHRTSGSLQHKVEARRNSTPSIDDVDLVQDITTDCSVVASLSAGVSRALKGHGKLLTSMMFPYDKDEARPRISKNGKYIFRMQFNGCFRKVVIDDRLPASNSLRTLHVVDRRDPLSLWPALIEKAYLKVRGGYDFPGSNSGTDLWVLTGWIPEQIFLRSDDFQSEQVWNRVSKAFSFGDVMVTLGTGKLTKLEEEEFGLAGEHDYAVLDVKQTITQRLMLVKNPWCYGVVSKPSQSSPQDNSSKSWTRDLAEALPETPPPASGTFWMAFEDVMQNFDNLYLSWNPGLFSYRQDHHFSWSTPQSTTSASTSLAPNPQYAVKSATSDVVWILLSRHFATGEQAIAREKRGTLADSSSALGFISLYIVDANGWAVYLSDEAMHRGPYVDSPQTSIQLDLAPGKSYTVVVAQHGLPLPKYNYTLSFFSRAPLAIAPALDRFPFCITRTGSWTARTAGGNASSPTYSANPQFSLSVPSPTDVSILLEPSSAAAASLAVHVTLVWGSGERVASLAARDVVGSSGDHRRGCALAEAKSVAAGTYTVVCSTFEAGQIGSFALRVRSMVECRVEPVLAETAGRLCTKLPVLSFERGVDRMLAPLVVQRITRMKIVVRSGGGEGAPRPWLKISVESGQGPNKSIVGVSGNGEFSDSPTGVRTGDLDVGPSAGYRGGLWVIVQRLGGGGRADIVELEVDILSDVGVGAGPWGTGDG